jgi:acyl-CoA hydrolase
MNELSFIIVTAAIDSIEFYYPISVDIDCTLSGYVSYVGRSSMEVHIDVLQKTGESEILACSANFVMVARNKQNGKAYGVPSMNYNGEKDTFRIIHELGYHRQVSRKRESAKAL